MYVVHAEEANISYLINLMSDVCHNVGLEPILQPITNERLHHSTANTEDGARVDIKAQGFGENDSVFFIDVRIHWYQDWARSSYAVQIILVSGHSHLQ